MTDYRKPVEDVVDDLKKYVDLRVDDVKLKATKGLSVSVARVLSALVLLFVLTIIVIILTVAFVLLLGQLTGNYALGAFSALGVFLVLFLVLFCLRKKMFTGTFVKLFISIFYPEDEEE